MQVNLKGQEMGSGSQLHLKGGVGSEWGGGGDRPIPTPVSMVMGLGVCRMEKGFQAHKPGCNALPEKVLISGYANELASHGRLIRAGIEPHKVSGTSPLDIMR